MTTDYVKVKGDVSLVLTDKDGTVKQQEATNMVVTSGLSFLASSLATITTSVFNNIAVGTNTTAAALGNTTLGTELSRVVVTSAVNTANSTTFVASFGAGVGVGALTEAGIFNATTAGTMLSRVVFSVINKASTDTLTITWTITLN